MAQPVKTQADVDKLTGEGQEQLLDWLDKGKGAAIQAGFEHMKGSPDSVDLTKPGKMLFIAPPKGAARAKEKVEADYGGDWSKLLDTVRCSLACDNYSDIPETVKMLTDSGMKLARKPKDRFASPTEAGYRDLLLNVTLPNGLIGEVQVHVKAMLTAKSKGHKHYETERSLDAKAQTGELTDEEKQTKAKALEAQKQIYNSAWEAANATASKKQGGTMAKAMENGAGTYTYFEYDNAYFRRQDRDGVRSIDDVLHGDEWVPYTGDRLAPAVYGDKCEDPTADDDGTDQGDWPKAGGGGGSDKPMRKAVLIMMKAQIKGGATADLFAAPVTVAGHLQGHTFVQPYIATRHKAPVHPPHPAIAAASVESTPQHGGKSGFPTIEAARADLQSQGFTAAGPYARHWTHPDGRKMILGNGSLKGKTGQSPGSGARWVFGYYPDTDQAAPKPVVITKPTEPEHLAAGRKILEGYQASIAKRQARGLGSGLSSASDEASMKLWEARLGADPARWKPGMGVTYQIASGGRGMQTNRGYRIVSVDAAGKQAVIRSVRDTGMTTSGGDHDRMDDMLIYLGELKRAKADDRL